MIADSPDAGGWLRGSAGVDRLHLPANSRSVTGDGLTVGTFEVVRFAPLGIR
jgi:hypothetical protein